MASADAYIEALQRRMRLHAFRNRARNGIPAGWESWFDAPPPGVSEHAEAIVAHLAARPPRPPPAAAPDPGALRAFAALFRQGWEPPDRDDRPLRVFAGGFSVFWHLAVFSLLAALLLARLQSAGAPPQGEEDVVQVEFIGTGTPENVGGGQAQPDRAEPPPELVAEPGRPAPAASAESGASPQAATADLPAQAPEPVPALPTPPAFEVATALAEPVLAPEPAVVPERELPAPAPRPQPLQVSEPVAETTTDFLLPPPTPRVEPREPAMSELQPTPAAVAEVAIPWPAPTLDPGDIGAVSADVPALQAPPALQLAEREVPMPPRELPPAPAVAVQVPDAQVRELRARAPEAPQRNVPMPGIRNAPRDDAPEVDGSAQDPDAVADVDDAQEAGAALPTAAPGQPVGATDDAMASASAGPRPQPAAGGWPDPAAGDDWGAADRATDGAQRGEPGGLFNSDGSVRLADSPAQGARGTPPGTVTEEIANLDRAGTWLRRPPVGHEPTMFEEYWRPSETLLAEWVRRSITTMRIPIPGSSKSLVCTTVLLAAGGGCWIEDPNMVDQPATARPPPDIPFKPELQEGDGALPAG